MVQFQSPVSAMPAIITTMKAIGSDPIWRIWVSIMNTMSAMNADSMNRSPWAKLTIPIMP